MYDCTYDILSHYVTNDSARVQRYSKREINPTRIAGQLLSYIWINIYMYVCLMLEHTSTCHLDKSLRKSKHFHALCECNARKENVVSTGCHNRGKSARAVRTNPWPSRPRVFIRTDESPFAILLAQLVLFENSLNAVIKLFYFHFFYLEWLNFIILKTLWKFIKFL